MRSIKSLICLVSFCLLTLVGCLPPKTSVTVVALKLPALFSDHMILQQGTACRVWGWAPNGTGVTVQINGQTAKAVAKAGRWQVHLPALEAGGPYRLTISTPAQTIKLNDVLVGGGTR